jgi:plasmid stabilization system protein ParE
MKYSVEWSKHAMRTYLRLVDNYLDLGRDKKAEELIERTDDIIALIGNLPELFPKVHGHPNVRKAGVTHEVRMFYLFNKQQVHLLLFWPSLSDSEELEIFLTKIASPD